MATRPVGATFKAKLSPAMPLPKTKKSKLRALTWPGKEGFVPRFSLGASWHCHRTASRPRLAAAPNAMARVNRFNATCAVERAASRGRLAVRSLGDVLCCGGSVKMRPFKKEEDDREWYSCIVPWLNFV